MKASLMDYRFSKSSSTLLLPLVRVGTSSSSLEVKVNIVNDLQNDIFVTQKIIIKLEKEITIYVSYD